MKKNNWLRQIVTIENKGYAAFKTGVSRDANPYTNGYRNQNGPGGNLQRSRAMAWNRGWEAAMHAKNERRCAGCYRSPCVCLSNDANCDPQ